MFKDTMKTVDCNAFNFRSKHIDTNNIVGAVSLVLRNKGGEVLKKHDNHNLIVYAGRHRLSRIVCGDNVLNNTVINILKIAGGAVVDGGDHLDPSPPLLTDTGLFEADPLKIVTFPVEVPTFNVISNETAPTATYSKIINSGDVDLVVNEVGLFFGDTGPLFAHYTFPTMDLRNNTYNSLEITWQLTF